MATSSITHNFIITNPLAGEMFADAVERAWNLKQTEPPKEAVKLPSDEEQLIFFKNLIRSRETVDSEK